MQVYSSLSGIPFYAPSAGFAPTNSADVSAIASAYQVVSATATQLYAGTAYLTSVNDAPISASRAGNAANASMANSAYYDGTGRLISSLPDSATVSAIASAYAESAASSKQDELTFSYDDNKISAINGSALAGQGGGGGSVASPSGTITVTDGTAIEATNSAIGTAEGLDVNNSGQANYSNYSNSYEFLGSYPTFKAKGVGLLYNSSTATRTAWVSANTDLGNLVSSFVLPASSISAGGLLSTSNIYSVWDSKLKIDGGSLTLSGSNPVLFVYPGLPYSAVKELAWKEDIPTPIDLGIYENIYNDKYVSSINSIPVSAKWAGSANYTYTAAQDPNGRYLSSLASKTSIPSGVTSQNGTIVANGFNVEATNSAVTTTIVPGYATTVVGNSGQLRPDTPVVCTLPSANENSKLFFQMDYGGDMTVSAVYDGITATASAGAGNVEVVLGVPNATTVSLYGSWYRDMLGSASASAADYLAPGSIAELAWASALPTYSYDSEDKISAINGSAIAGGAGGVDSATVSAIASSYAESAVSGKADSSALSSYALSADVSGTVDLVSTQSANWGGSALALSAGPGVKLEKVGNTLVASTDETVLWSNTEGKLTKDLTFPLALNETITNFKRVKFLYGGDSYVQNAHWIEFEATDNNPYTLYDFRCNGPSTTDIFWRLAKFNISGTAVTNTYNSTINLNTAFAGNGYNTSGYNYLVQIVGVNRTAEA